MGFLAVTLQSGGIMTVYCLLDIIYQLATMMETIHLLSMPYIHGSFQGMWLLMKRLRQGLGALQK